MRRNEVYGFRDHSPGSWNHNAWDRDQANNKNGFRDQNSHRFWDQELTLSVKICDQLRKNIPSLINY